MKISDLKLAELFGVTDRTIRNYKAIEKEHEKKGFIPYAGKHKLYRAMILYYYLNVYEEYTDPETSEKESEIFNRLEILIGNIEGLETDMNYLKDKVKDKDEITEAVASSAVEKIKSALTILEEVRSIS